MRKAKVAPKKVAKKTKKVIEYKGTKAKETYKSGRAMKKHEGMEGKKKEMAEKKMMKMGKGMTMFNAKKAVKRAGKGAKKVVARAKKGAKKMRG